ncbi:DsbA family protein [Shewanella sp. KT0246]|uniref:DsbA family protein n=1 Tax=Shewanella sp. KT0246 TaxID=2815912 RepID=UPI001BC17558|nr:DsbA family protein [Shewanella sp. KT0246]GIU53885.1 DsbA family protein [Shewanella sp. KT0246]
MTDSARLIYVYDPMCSWCWGYRPTWLALQQQLTAQLPELIIEYRLGGLAPDSDVAMPKDMQQFLSQTWHKIASQLGTEFNYDFWQDCQPRRSTYPACRACLIAREYGLEQAMILAIQQAYYLQAKNPSDNDTLINAAVSIGIEQAAFTERLLSEEVNLDLISELEVVHQLPVRGFPSLVLEVNGEALGIPLDYLNPQTSLDAVVSALG